DLLRRELHRGELLRHPLPDIVDKTLTATGAYAPELGIGSAGQFFLDRLQRAAPALGARPSGPERVGLSGVPRGRVHAVGDVSHRDLRLRPPWKERLKDAPAHAAVHTAHAVDGAASADGEVRHVERLADVVRI